MGVSVDADDFDDYGVMRNKNMDITVHEGHFKPLTIAYVNALSAAIQRRYEAIESYLALEFWHEIEMILQFHIE